MKVNAVSDPRSLRETGSNSRQRRRDGPRVVALMGAKCLRQTAAAACCLIADGFSLFVRSYNVMDVRGIDTRNQWNKQRRRALQPEIGLSRLL